MNGKGKEFSLLSHGLSMKGMLNNSDNPQSNFSQRPNRIGISMYMLECF